MEEPLKLRLRHTPCVPLALCEGRRGEEGAHLTHTVHAIKSHYFTQTWGVHGTTFRACNDSLCIVIIMEWNSLLIARMLILWEYYYYC